MEDWRSKIISTHFTALHQEVTDAVQKGVGVSNSSTTNNNLGQPHLDVVVIRGDQVLGKRNEKRNIGGKECNVIETLQRIPTESEVEEMGAAEATSAEGRTMMEG